MLRPLAANPHALLFLTALLWASQWIAARAVVPYASPIAMSFWRWAIAILLMLPLAGPALVRDWPRIRDGWRPILFFGTISTVLYMSVGYFGIQYSTATNAALFQSFTPAWIPIFTLLMFGERLRPITAIGLAMSFLGVMVIITRMDLGALLSLRLNQGDIWLLVNTALWALYTACLRWRPKGIDSLAFLLAVALCGMLTGIPAYLIDYALGGRVEANATVVLGIFYIAAIPSLLCYVMWAKGVAMLGPVKAGAYLHFIPPLGALMAMAFLGEEPRLYHLVGFLLILGGVWVAASRRV